MTCDEMSVHLVITSDSYHVRRGSTLAEFAQPINV